MRVRLENHPWRYHLLRNGADWSPGVPGRRRSNMVSVYDFAAEPWTLRRTVSRRL
jgi:hypothetical protein